MNSPLPRRRRICFDSIKLNWNSIEFDCAMHLPSSPCAGESAAAIAPAVGGCHHRRRRRHRGSHSRWSCARPRIRPPLCRCARPRIRPPPCRCARPRIQPPSCRRRASALGRLRFGRYTSKKRIFGFLSGSLLHRCSYSTRSTYPHYVPSVLYSPYIPTK